MDARTYKIRVTRLVLNWWRDAVLNPVLSTPLMPSFLRWRLLRRMTAGTVAKSRIEAGGWFGGKRLDLGEGAFIGYESFIDSSEWVRIGPNTRIGPRVTICTSSHTVGGREMRGGAAAAAPIEIGAGSWLGANVTVLPGVTIGSGVVVAAGSVVARDCEANGLYAGVPARLVKVLGD
ncbi:DapH/DapD/GlmU-related protein [Pseudarthrobacter sp. PvP090]|uniref:acyltransferase n=1 Tax=Pseudarthrobacter sp. PvP090 TaxID=3156393 RepID=UPI00339399D9